MATVTPPGFIGNASCRQAHFDAGERSCDHEIMEITEMADTEHFVGQFAQTTAQRHVETVQDIGAQAVC